MNSQTLYSLFGRLQSDSAVSARIFSACLAPLESLYLVLLNSRKSRALSRQETLPLPVISVGNLTVGGSGKSVFVLWLASRLTELGIRPAIVARGYRGHISTPQIVSSSDPLRFGDEPALFHSLGFTVSVGKNRYEAARLLLAESGHPPDCIILDDGFQYWSLFRNADIVLYDVSQGLWTHCLPRGPLREPLTALARASAIFLSRSQDLPESAVANFEQIFRKNCFQGPVFRMEIFGVPETIPDEPVVYVVGTGNPGAVLQSLRWHGQIMPLVFPDHEAYGPASLSRIRTAVKTLRARSVIATRKDFIKLQGRDLGAPLIPVNTRVAIPEESAFFQWLFRQVPALRNPDPNPSSAPK